MLACDVFTVVGAAGLFLGLGITLGSFLAAVRQSQREDAFRSKMRSRYGGR